MANGNGTDIQGLVSDPQFQGLPAAQKREALFKLTEDTSFNQLSDDDTQQFVSRMSRPTLATMMRQAGAPVPPQLQPPGGIGKPLVDPRVKYSEGPVSRVMTHVESMIPDEITPPMSDRSVPLTGRTVPDPWGSGLQVAESGVRIENPLKMAWGMSPWGQAVEAGRKIGTGRPEEMTEGAIDAANAAQMGRALTRAVRGTGAPRLVSRVRGEPPVPPGLGDEATSRMTTPAARIGAENVFRAAAPAGGDIDFRKSLAIAAPDLAEIERQTPLRQSGTAGGILRPDFRVRQTVANIDSHLEAVWNNERMPQILRHADQPLAPLGELAQNIEPEALQAVARKMQTNFPAEPNAMLTVGQADELLHSTNAYLRGIEGRTPEGQALARAVNPAIDALYDLKKSLRTSIGQKLEQLGEPGTREFDMRYGALSDVRDVLRTRMNPAEADRLVNRIRLFGSLRGGGLSAHEGLLLRPTPGRMLQTGMEQLARSPLRVAMQMWRFPEAPIEGGEINGPLFEGGQQTIPFEDAPSYWRVPPRPRALGPAPIELGPVPPSSEFTEIPYEPTRLVERMGRLLPEKASGGIPQPESKFGQGVLRAAQVIVRDPRTGQMKVVYLNTPLPPKEYVRP